MILDPALISLLLGRHPARRMPFDELHAGLLRGVEAKNINVSRDGDLALFGYTSTCQFEGQWDLFSLIARGLILDVAERRVVATPFPKFFNFGEAGISLPDEPFEVTEKIDGSLGILFFHQGQWRVSTRGQLASSQGEWATRYVRTQIDTNRLLPGATYLVEIVYAENRVVIPYSFEGLVLLGGYDAGGDEFRRGVLESIADCAGLRIARSVACGSFDDLHGVARSLTRHEEGFVIRFAGGLRLKLKGEAYCRVHKLVCRCTPIALWESMAACEDLEAMRRELPEEMRLDFDVIRRLLTERLDAVVLEIQAGHDKTKTLSDKELGLLLQNPRCDLTPAQRKFVFACRKEPFFESIRQRGEWREKLFRLLRPDRNRLAGYVASTAMTRFGEESG